MTDDVLRLNAADIARLEAALDAPAIGAELDERYCEIAAKRLAQDALDLTGEAS